MHASTLAVSLLLATACAFGTTMTAASTTLAPDNPFALESTLPYKLPPLDKIQNAHFAPGLTAGMAEQRKEIDAIKSNGAAPTFENTIVALEKSGDLLNRVSTVFFNLSSSNSNPEIEAVQTDMAPNCRPTPMRSFSIQRCSHASKSSTTSAMP